MRHERRREHELPLRELICKAIHRFNRGRPVVTFESSDSYGHRYHGSRHRRHHRHIHASNHLALMPYTSHQLVRYGLDGTSSLGRRHLGAPIVTNKTQICAAYEILPGGHTVAWLNCSTDGKHSLHMSRWRREPKREQRVRISKSVAFDMPVRVNNRTGEIDFPHKSDLQAFLNRAKKFPSGRKVVRELVKIIERPPDKVQWPGCFVCQSMPEIISHKRGQPLSEIRDTKALIKGIRSAAVQGGMRMRFYRDKEGEWRPRTMKVYLVNDGHHSYGTRHRRGYYDEPHLPPRYGLPSEETDEPAIICVDRPRKRRGRKRHRHAAQSHHFVVRHPWDWRESYAEKCAWQDACPKCNNSLRSKNYG